MKGVKKRALSFKVTQEEYEILNRISVAKGYVRENGNPMYSKAFREALENYIEDNMFRFVESAQKLDK